MLLLLFIYLAFLNKVSSSIGDSTPFYSNCRFNCKVNNCSEDGTILTKAREYYRQTVFDNLLQWSCDDECQYECMWRTVDAFLHRKWDVPQFYGKWPFVRFLGIQEPASVVFSIMNLISNVYLLLQFRKEVHPKSPCYFVWHANFIVSINGWIWSTVFHARDFPLTELMDYASAYSIVLVALFCMVMRFLWNTSVILKGLITAVFLCFYLNYFAYLAVGHFSYGYNMKVNICTGLLSGLGWMSWAALVYQRRSYYWKIIIFYIFLALAMSLEVLDFPPLFWTFDAHSLWHLSSIPLNFILYSFITDDCKALKLEKDKSYKKD